MREPLFAIALLATGGAAGAQAPLPQITVEECAAGVDALDAFPRSVVGASILQEEVMHERWRTLREKLTKECAPVIHLDILEFQVMGRALSAASKDEKVCSLLKKISPLAVCMK